jgi:hypothetical protein
MLTFLRRFLVLVGLMFWQGGFLFYASVVVPIAQAKLGHRGQGFITNEVTNFLNLSGAVALALFAWDLAALPDQPRPRRYLLWTCWSGMLVTLILLARLHLVLADMMIPAGRQLTNASLFHTMHRWYLWISTVQWVFALGYTGLTIRAWGDAGPVPRESWEMAAEGRRDSRLEDNGSLPLLTSKESR